MGDLFDAGRVQKVALKPPHIHALLHGFQTDLNASDCSLLFVWLLRPLWLNGSWPGIELVDK